MFKQCKMFCIEGKGHFSTSTQILGPVFVPGPIFYAEDME